MAENRPVKELRLGAIKATIWLNATTNGNGKRFSVQVNRLYRQGEHWKQSSSFGRQDLPVVAKVADMAHSWIFTQRREDHGRQE